MIKALDFVILRNVEANGRIGIPMERKPVCVATLLNEELFNQDNLLVHHKTVFLEDYIHDWNWHDGKFFYYSRVGSVCDVVVVYGRDKNYVPAPRYCEKTGIAL